MCLCVRGFDMIRVVLRHASGCLVAQFNRSMEKIGGGSDGVTDVR